MTDTILRLVVSPALPPHVLDDLTRALESRGRVLAASNDVDVNSSAVSVACAPEAFDACTDTLVDHCKNHTAGRAFRVEWLADDPRAIADETVRSLAVRMHGAFAAPVFIARREVPAAAWAFARPMPWGRKGLAVGQTAPSLPYGGSECLGAAIEIGTPTLLMRARLDGVPEHGLVRACAAVGGADSGFADVAAYPAVSAADGASVVVLEFGNAKRSPPHRALAVLDIEARRFGGRVGQVALLSHIPLDALLDTLKFGIGLGASAAQVLETHLPAGQPR